MEPECTGDTEEDAAAATSVPSVRVALFLSAFGVPMSRICCINWYCAAMDPSKSRDLSAALERSKAAAAAAAAGEGGSTRVGDDVLSVTLFVFEFGPLCVPCSSLLFGV
jgi:hypothetical protein